MVATATWQGSQGPAKFEHYPILAESPRIVVFPLKAGPKWPCFLIGRLNPGNLGGFDF